MTSTNVFNYPLATDDGQQVSGLPNTEIDGYIYTQSFTFKTDSGKFLLTIDYDGNNNVILNCYTVGNDVTNVTSLVYTYTYHVSSGQSYDKIVASFIQYGELVYVYIIPHLYTAMYNVDTPRISDHQAPLIVIRFDTFVYEAVIITTASNVVTEYSTFAMCLVNSLLYYGIFNHGNLNIYSVDIDSNAQYQQDPSTSDPISIPQPYPYGSKKGYVYNDMLVYTSKPLSITGQRNYDIYNFNFESMNSLSLYVYEDNLIILNANNGVNTYGTGNVIPEYDGVSFPGNNGLNVGILDMYNLTNGYFMNNPLVQIKYTNYTEIEDPLTFKTYSFVTDKSNCIQFDNIGCYNNVNRLILFRVSPNGPTIEYITNLPNI